MGKHNYNKDFKKDNVEEQNVEPEVEETVESEPEVEEETAEEQNSVITGTVINCTRLNVRATPKLNAAILCTIDKSSEVIIEDDSNEKFYKIVTGAGVEGYCMKDYVVIK